MSNSGEPINIFVHDKDDPAGIRTCEISHSAIESFIIPRDKLNSDEAKELLSDKATVYFLIGEGDEGDKPIAYIGESETPSARMRDHKGDERKDFFDTVICFKSAKNNLNKAHIKCIETLCIEEAEKSNKFIIKNDKNNQYTLDKADAFLSQKFYENIKVILGVLGYPIFKESSKSDSEKLFLKTKGIEAEAEYSKGMGTYYPKGMKVSKGSQAVIIEEKNYAKFANKKRKELLAIGILKEKDGCFEFTEDYTFNTPSGAAQVICGRNANGRTDWKNKDGKTWAELYGGDDR